jgi:hypothetical protein
MKVNLFQLRIFFNYFLFRPLILELFNNPGKLKLGSFYPFYFFISLFSVVVFY